VLGLKPGASLEEVNRAYKQLALRWHPDRVSADQPHLQREAHEKLQEINDARDRLRDVLERNGDRSTRGETATKSRKEHRQSQPSSHGGPKRSRHHSHHRTQRQSRPNRHTAEYRQQAAQQAASERAQREAAVRARRQAEAASQQARQQARATANRKSKPTFRRDLTGVNLQGADLSEKDLSRSNLQNANLSRADLRDSFLHNVNLDGANLEGANLFRANLLEASLMNANLRGANLIGADFSGADLRGADLRDAKVGTKDRLFIKITGANLTGMILPDGSVHKWWFCLVYYKNTKVQRTIRRINRNLKIFRYGFFVDFFEDRIYK